MLVTITPNFALFSYFTTDRFHYQLYGHLERCLKTHEGIWTEYLNGLRDKGLAHSMAGGSLTGQSQS